MYEEQKFPEIRKDALGILLVRTGNIIPLRFYELEENSNKILANGYTRMRFFLNYYGESGGTVLLNVDTREATIHIYNNEKNYFRSNDLKKLYCKNCQKKIKALNSNFDYLLMDYNDYEVYSLTEKINMKIRNYTISSKESSWTEVTVKYTPN